MNTDIYIRERNGSREIRVPWLPAEIKFESGGTTVATYDILNKGEVVVPAGVGLSRVSWTSQFPGEYRTDAGLLRGPQRDPSYYTKILESWRKNGTELNLLVTGYPINMDAVLEDYTYSAVGGFGDVEYDVTFVEDVNILIEKKTVATTSTTTKRPATTTTSYTIKKGDTLWGIAKRFLGAGSKWQTIYDLNKTIIESTAKKYGKKSSNNGWWIYPGCVIAIPSDGKSVSSTSSSSTSSSKKSSSKKSGSGSTNKITQRRNYNNSGAGQNTPMTM